MYDSFKRRINYLRLSVTDRCNLRCTYCMPEGGVASIDHSQVMRFEEMVDVVREAVSMGIDKVRLTGGEPLVRKGIVSLVSMIAAIDGVKDLSMTTNAVLLEKHAVALKEAGLHRLNISLDSVDHKRFAEITRIGSLDVVLAGIAAARKAGFSTIKLNCVVRESSTEPDAVGVLEYGRKYGHEVRFIRQMNLLHGEFWVVEGGSGGDCAKCNRLRLTSDGMIKPCLFNDIAFSVKEYGAREALRKAIEYKPEAGQKNETGCFYNIGG